MNKHFFIISWIHCLRHIHQNQLLTFNSCQQAGKMADDHQSLKCGKYMGYRIVPLV